MNLKELRKEIENLLFHIKISKCQDCVIKSRIHLQGIRQVVIAVDGFVEGWCKGTPNFEEWQKIKELLK